MADDVPLGKDELDLRGVSEIDGTKEKARGFEGRRQPKGTAVATIVRNNSIVPVRKIPRGWS